MIIAPKRHRSTAVAVFFCLVLLFVGLRYASAETPGQPGTHPTATDSAPASAETKTSQPPSSPDAQQTRTTGSGIGTKDTGTVPGKQPDMSLTQPAHFIGPEPVMTPGTPAESPAQFTHPEPVMTPGAPAEPQKPKTPVAKEVPGPQLGPQVDPCFTVSVAGDNWMDQVHGFVQDSTCEPAVWFDTFFVKDHVLLDLRPGAFIKLRNSAWWSEGDMVTNINDFRIEWDLPQWKTVLKRWRLIIESRSDADKYSAQPGQPVSPGVNRQTGVRKPVVGLRADVFTWLRSLVSIESGAQISLHPDAFIRMRYQYTKPFSEVYLLRFSEIAMWQTIEHFTNTLQLDVERKISTFKMVRWGNNITHTEGTSGVTWNTGISLLTQLTPKSAISYDASMWGVNRPYWLLQNYRIGTLYRRNFYRPWLFFELSPEMTLPKDVSGKRNSVYAFMATLEMQFGK